MIIKRLVSDTLDANCYIVDNILIDPCVSYERVYKENPNICAILITHGHVDHILHLKELVEKFKCTVYCHKNARTKIENKTYNCSEILKMPLEIHLSDEDYEFVYDGEILDIDNKKVGVIGTPGHTNCSLCFTIEDCLFTGDTLFDRSIGRTDLYSGNSAKMLDSLKRLIRMKKDYTIYPGHNESSILSIQKEINEYLRKINDSK